MPAPRDPKTGRFTSSSVREPKGQRRFKPGDEVRVQLGLNFFPATVVEADRTWVRVNIWVEGVDETLSSNYRTEDLAQSA